MACHEMKFNVRNTSVRLKYKSRRLQLAECVIPSTSEGRREGGRCKKYADVKDTAVRSCENGRMVLAYIWREEGEAG
jgi:hypothetical protein